MIKKCFSYRFVVKIMVFYKGGHLYDVEIWGVIFSAGAGGEVGRRAN